MAFLAFLTNRMRNYCYMMSMGQFIKKIYACRRMWMGVIFLVKVRTCIPHKPSNADHEYPGGGGSFLGFFSVQ